MSFWTFKKKPYPILAFAASIFFIVFGLVMVNRFGAVFLSIALGMSMEPIDMTRNLSTLRVPRGITLGMLIATSFPPVLRAEKQRVREAMQTRGAGTISAGNPASANRCRRSISTRPPWWKRSVTGTISPSRSFRPRWRT